MWSRRQRALIRADRQQTTCLWRTRAGFSGVDRNPSARVNAPMRRTNLCITVEIIVQVPCLPRKTAWSTRVMRSLSPEPRLLCGPERFHGETGQDEQDLPRAFLLHRRKQAGAQALAQAGQVHVRVRLVLGNLARPNGVRPPPITVTRREDDTTQPLPDPQQWHPPWP